MTTPVGSGRNACYGYEDEVEVEPEISDPPQGGIMEEGSYFLCSVPPVNYTMETPHPAGGPPCDLDPDYQTLSASMSLGLTATVSTTIDRYGHQYTAGGLGLTTPGVSGALLKGYLRDPSDICDPPNAEQLDQFLSGVPSTQVPASSTARESRTPLQRDGSQWRSDR